MSGPIVPPLQVTEVDGSPDGRPITKLVVSNGSLSISGRTATITTGGGGGSGTVTSITNAADSGSGTAITTSGTFTYTGGTGVTTAVSGTTVTITADNNGTVTNITPAADSGSGTAITSSGTLTFTGGTRVTTSVSGTTVTIDNDAIEGTAVLSTGETGATKFLREDGDGTSSWQAATATVEGTAVLSTGETAATKFLREDGDGTSSWQAATATIPDPILLGNGDVSDPTYSFSSDTDTGMYRAASNSLAFTTEGTQRLRISASGLQGIPHGTVSLPGISFLTDTDTGVYLSAADTLNLAGGGSDFLEMQHDGTATDFRVGTGSGVARITASGSQDIILQTNDGTNSGTITITDGVDGAISLTPDGDGYISFNNEYKFPIADGDANQVLTTDGVGALTFEDAGGGGGGGISSVLPLLGSTGADQYNIGTAMPWGNSSTATQTVIAFGGQAHAFPFIAPETGTVDEIGVRVTTGDAGMSLYVAIYSQDSNNLPSTLLGYATIPLDATGNIYDSSLSANPSLTAGTAYWYTIHGDQVMYNANVQSNTLSYLPDLGITDDLLAQPYSIEDGAMTQYAVPPASLTPNTLNSTITRPYVGIKYA